MVNSRTKLFLENFLAYGLGSIIAKIAPIIMLPIISRLMPDTTYYGLNDLSTITVSFGSAIAVMGMYDAMFRMYFEKDEIQYKKEICSSALIFVIISGVAICLILFLLKSYFSVWIFNNIKYINLLNFTSFTILINTISSIVVAPSRMQNKKEIYLFLNTLSPIIGYSISIPMLLHKNYIYALPAAAAISSGIMLIAFGILNRKWFSIKNINKKLIKEMLKIGIPLMPTFLVYWIYTSCDRVMISKILGNNYVGIYGIGARVASISQFIYLAFAGGWQYFAFSTMKDDDQVELTSKIFEYLALISFTTFVILMPFSYYIFKFLFAGDYINGYIVFPYLFLSPLILMLFQTFGTQFLIINKAWLTTLILSIGAIINVILNNVLINLIGIEGAAISTLIGYVASVIVSGIVLSKLRLIHISKRSIVMSIVLMIYIVSWRLFTPSKVVPALFISIPTLLIFFYLYKIDIIMAYNNMKKFLRRDKSN
jgi:O-antigen/teichoic acid export membrane protein